MQIISIMLNNVKSRLEEHGINIEIDDSVKKLIFEKGFDKNYGARPLRRAIQTYVEDFISEAVLEGSVDESKNFLIKVEDDSKVVVV